MAWKLLLTSDIGLLSLFTILFMVVMPFYILRFIARHMKQEDGDARASHEMPRAH